MMVSKPGEAQTELVACPVIKSFVEESPESPEEDRRKAFFEHKKQFFIFTTAGKPIFSR